MVALLSLEPRLYPRDGGKVFQELIFLCPKCRKHEISVAFWNGRATRLEIGKREDGTPDIRNLWHVEGSDFNDMTLTPSIDRTACNDECGGWHGFIANGIAT